MENMNLTFVNVGYGEAILVSCPDASAPDGVFTMLIDGGSGLPEEYQNQPSGRLPVTEFVRRSGLGHLDAMVSTHIHEDHLCGLAALPDTLMPKGSLAVFAPGLLPPGDAPPAGAGRHCFPG